MSELVQRRRLGAAVALYHDIQQRKSWPFLRRSFAHQWNPPEKLSDNWDFPPEEKLWNLYNEPHFLGFQKSGKTVIKRTEDREQLLNQLSSRVKRVKLQCDNENGLSFLAECPDDCEPKWSTPDSQLLKSHNVDVFLSNPTESPISSNAHKNVPIEYVLDLEDQLHSIKQPISSKSPNSECAVCGQEFPTWEIFLFHFKMHHPLLLYETGPFTRQSDGAHLPIVISGVTSTEIDADLKDFSFTLPAVPNRFQESVRKLTLLQDSRLSKSESTPRVNGFHERSPRTLKSSESKKNPHKRHIQHGIERMPTQGSLKIVLNGHRDRDSQNTRPKAGWKLKPLSPMQERSAKVLGISLATVGVSHRNLLENNRSVRKQRERYHDDLLSVSDSTSSPNRDHNNGKESPVLPSVGQQNENAIFYQVNRDFAHTPTPEHTPPRKRRKLSLIVSSHDKERPPSPKSSAISTEDRRSPLSLDSRKRRLSRVERSTKSPKEWPNSVRQDNKQCKDVMRSEQQNSIPFSVEDGHSIPRTNTTIAKTSSLLGRPANAPLPARHRAKYLVPPAPGPGRRFFRNVSKRVVEEGELLSESDDDVDQHWLEQRHIDRIKSSRRWTPAQKEFLVRWDIHFLRENLQGRRFVGDATKRFVSANIDWLRGSVGREEFFAKLESLKDNGTITVEVVAVCRQLLDVSTVSTAITTSSTKAHVRPFVNLSTPKSRQPDNVKNSITPRAGLSRSFASLDGVSANGCHSSSGLKNLATIRNSLATPETAQSSYTAATLLSGGSSASPTPIRRKKAASSIETTRDQMDKEELRANIRPTMISDIMT